MPAFTIDDLRAINAEFAENPLNLDYLAFTDQNDDANASKLNEVRPTLLVWRGAIPTSELEINADEFAALAPAQREWYLGVATRDGIINPAANDTIREDVLRMFGPNTATGESLRVTFKRAGSRLEQLYQEGKLSTWHEINPSEVAAARAQ